MPSSKTNTRDRESSYTVLPRGGYAVAKPHFKLEAANRVIFPGVMSDIQRTSSDQSGRIPISALIEPTDYRESPTRDLPIATPRISSSSSNNPPAYYHQQRTSLPVSYLTNPVSSETPPRRTNHDFGLFHRRGSEVSPTDLDRSQTAWDRSELARKPRPPRPSYSEEQKFFIMYARIIRECSWPDIEDQFADIFGQRSKGGLTSVYYRVRRDWGLTEVLKSGPGSFTADCREVEKRALNFSAEFLSQIKYIERY